MIATGQQVLQAVNQTQRSSTPSAQQLQNAKARLITLTKGAQGEGFIVTPVGKVQSSARATLR